LRAVMADPPKDQTERRRTFALEIVAYATLVGIFCLLVVTFLSPFLRELSVRHRPAYAALAVSLMVVQGYVLERAAGAFAEWRARRGKGRT
jgi:hypothetical protein